MKTWLVLFVTSTLMLATASLGAEPPKAREFQFRYEAVVSGLKPGQTARIWLPVPPSDDDQEVTIVRRDLPAEGKIDKESKYGNEILYVEGGPDADGRISLGMIYRIKRREVTASMAEVPADIAKLFLKPDA